MDRDHDNRAWLAWHVAALSRQTRLPKLSSLLSKKRVPSKPQTQTEIAQAIRSIFLTFGGDPKELEKLNV